MMKNLVEGPKEIVVEHSSLNFMLGKLSLRRRKITKSPASQPPILENQTRHHHTFDHDHDHDDMNPPSFSDGQSSTSTSFNTPSATFVCGLCLKPIQLEDSFDFKGCAHFYCTPCIVNFVVSKLQDNVDWTLHCPVPTCTGTLDPDNCRPILPNEVFDSWMNALCDQIEQSSYGGESSNSSTTFKCDFCVEEKHLSDSFNVKDCSHFYCHQCIVNFVVSKLEDNVTSIVCPEPGCRGVLDLQYCQPILPKDVFDRWGKALCENVILGSESNDKYYYCPFKDCSALLVLDNPVDEYHVFSSKCPHCKRLVCLKCKVPWHTEFDCDKFQKLRDKGEDEMVKELAKKRKWRKCPKCNYYVEKKDGCTYIRCRYDLNPYIIYFDFLLSSSPLLLKSNSLILHNVIHDRS